MKKTFLFMLILSLCLGLVVPFSIAKDQATNDKEIENLFDDAIKDAGVSISSAIAVDKQQPEVGTLAGSVAPEGKLAQTKKEPQDLIDLEFNQANIEDVVRLIAETSGRNIVLDPALQGKKIELHLKKVSVDQALEILYSAYGLSSSLIGDILFISTQEKIRKGTFKTSVRELKNINVEDAKALIGNLVTTVNQSKGTNTVVMMGALEDITKVEEILDRIDVPQPQVLLEAKIIEINNDALQELGVDWSDQISIGVQETARPTTLSTTATADEGPMYLYKFARSAVQFNLILKMLENNNKAKVLSNPRVTTMNNKEAEIFIGDKIPYTVSIVSGGVITTEVRFVEPGIRLKITPSIIEKDFVVIKIEPEVSYIYSWRGTGDQYPWIKARQAMAHVRVANGQPFVLGGLLSNEDKNNLYRIPYLGKIPLLGNLFTYEKKILYNTDLIITVTPTIISGTS